MFVAVIGFAASFSSCKKCGNCVVNGVEGSEVCKKDAGSAGYDLVKSSCEASGGSWEE